MITFYKIIINLPPFFRGVLKYLLYNLFRSNIKINSGIRIKKNTEWKLFPKCIFESGKNLIVGKDTTINVASNALLKLGANVGIGNRCQIVCHKRIEVGEGTILAPNTIIYDHNHIYDSQNGVHQREFSEGEVFIGKHCWIGAGCIILKDVHIGDNCVIGAGSVVTKNIPSCSIAVGVPAKVIKQIQK